MEFHDPNISIESGSFDKCPLMKSVEFHPSLKIISINIQTIFIPAGVRQIHSNSFANNSQLTIVKYCGVQDSGIGFRNQFQGYPRIVVEFIDGKNIQTIELVGKLLKSSEF